METCFGENEAARSIRVSKCCVQLILLDCNADSSVIFSAPSLLKRVILRGCKRQFRMSCSYLSAWKRSSFLEPTAQVEISNGSLLHARLGRN